MYAERSGLQVAWVALGPRAPLRRPFLWRLLFLRNTSKLRVTLKLKCLKVYETQEPEDRWVMFPFFIRVAAKFYVIF